VFAAADHLAVGAYHAIREAGLRVGEDVSVVAVAGPALAAALQPPLTAFDHQRRELGVQAVELLLEQIEGRETTERSAGAGPEAFARVLQATLVERESCRPPAGRAPELVPAPTAAPA
jgi:DNA-binding LacI/PurR family transcriptional regulator